MKRKVPQVEFRPLFKKKLTFLHIPKTGGTALKNALLDNPACIDIFRSHDRTLANVNQPVCFVLRDPLERFCSGFWERKHTALRHAQTADPANQRYARGGYTEWTELETEIFSRASTPNEFISMLRTDTELERRLRSSNCALDQTTRSLTYWLGALPRYQSLEHRVHAVIDMKCLSQGLSELFGVELEGQAPFVRRSQTAFGVPVDNTVSDHNTEWFLNQYRKDDYELVAYIKTRPYFYTS